jgi:hypothetical protein
MTESSLLASLQESAVDAPSRGSHHHRSSRYDDDRSSSRRGSVRDDDRHRRRRSPSDKHHRDERRSENRRSSRRSSTERDRGHQEPRADVLPLHERVSRTGAWDKPPPGCEGMTSAQVKNSGIYFVLHSPGCWG